MIYTFSGTHISEISSVVPAESEGIEQWKVLFQDQWQAQLTEQTGIRSLRKSHRSSLDLGLAACRALYLNETRPSAIISVTQTPVRQFPGNASALAAGMGWLGEGTQAAPLCWDLQMGCAGLVWGLYQAAMLLQQPGMNEVLLICAETHSRVVNPTDRATCLLFGDGASAIKVVKSANKSPWKFALGTQPDATNQLCTSPQGYLHMDGLGIFNFSVGTVAPAITAFLKESGIDKSDIGTYLLHQASGFVLKYLQRMLQIPDEKMPVALDGYGNTASASIGILLSHHFAEKQNPELKNALLIGFGSGLQWGVMSCDLSETRIRSMQYAV